MFNSNNQDNISILFAIIINIKPKTINHKNSVRL